MCSGAGTRSSGRLLNRRCRRGRWLDPRLAAALHSKGKMVAESVLWSRTGRPSPASAGSNHFLGHQPLLDGEALPNEFFTSPGTLVPSKWISRRNGLVQRQADAGEQRVSALAANRARCSSDALSRHAFSAVANWRTSGSTRIERRENTWRSPIT